jgi:nickel/cobalt exporter
LGDKTLGALMAASISVAVVHTFAPDHWLPFVMFGKSLRWSRLRVGLVALGAGILHVGSSVVIGIAGLALGIAVERLSGVEASRGSIAAWLLIGFGVAYALWGLRALRHGHSHSHHVHLDPSRQLTVWALIVVFVLGPCEPLIPLMFAASAFGSGAVVAVSVAFSISTISVMIILSVAAFSGLSVVWSQRLDKYTHSIAGAVVALTGVAIIALGI